MVRVFRGQKVLRYPSNRHAESPHDSFFELGGFMAQQISIHQSGIEWLPERIGSALAGGALIAISRRLPSSMKFGAILGGGILLYWGATGDPRLCRFIGYKGRGTRSGVASVHHDKGIRLEKSVTVAGPVSDLYRIWRNPENLPCFVDHLKSVRSISDRRSHWILEGPTGSDVEWESEIYNEKENDSFAWRSLLNADVNNAGSVHFRSLPGSNQTEVRVIMSYEPPGGTLGSWIAKMFGNDPEAQLERDLLYFKQAFESGLLTAR